MRRSTRKIVLSIGLASLAISATAAAKMMREEFFSGSTVSFQMQGRPIGGS
jgi:hypothetical protein